MRDSSIKKIKKLKHDKKLSEESLLENLIKSLSSHVRNFKKNFDQEKSSKTGLFGEKIKTPKENVKATDFVEFRCIKLDLRGKSILGEVTWPDRGKLFMKERKNLICEFEEIHVNTSLKKRKDAITRMNMMQFSSMIRRVWGNDFNPQDCFTLNYENVFDGNQIF